MDTVTCQLVGETIVLVHSDKAPSPAGWNEYLDLVEQSREQMRCTLVHSIGGAPDAKQRADLKVVYQRSFSKEPPVAVLTTNAFARGVVTTLGWFYGNIRAFSPFELEAALRWLAVTPKNATEIRKALPLLRARISA
jgi:hypothetical protein